MFALAFAPEYGGTGTGTLTFLRAVEELSLGRRHRRARARGAGAGRDRGRCWRARRSRSSRYLPRWASGEWIGGLRADRGRVGLRRAGDADHGARRDGDEWVIDGSQAVHHQRRRGPHLRRLRPHGRRGHLGLHGRARTPPASRCRRIEPKMGIKGSTTGELLFDGCRVAPAALIGEEGSGFRIGHARARPLAAGDRRPGARASPRPRSTTRCATRPSGMTFGKPIAEHAGRSSSCWPTWRRRSRPAAGCSTTSARCWTRASTAPELTRRVGHGQADVLGHGDGA